MILHTAQCERCDTRRELAKDEGYPQDWLRMFYDRPTSKQKDLCPQCAVALDHWMQGQEQLT